MSETSKWQLLLILIVVGIAGYFAYPSQTKWLFDKGEIFEGKRIQLGLDLQGGSELRLALKKEGLAVSNIKDDTEKAKEILERRINLFGLKEPRIQRYGNDQILIQLPGMELSEVERVKKIITSSGKLDFKLEADRKIVSDFTDRFPKAPAGYMWYERTETESGDEPSDRVLVEEKASLTGDMIVKAGVSFQNFKQVVTFELNKKGGAILAQISKQYSEETSGDAKRRLAIILDNKLVSAPVLKSPITDGKGIIEGSFTAQRAQDLATVLRSGSLPASLELISENYVGPTLGEDAIKKGILAFVLAIIAVILFMLIYYHIVGFIAVIAMAMNFILLVGILSFFGATMTMPGIAALVLTLGMAVDANIIFYERIREEANKGKDAMSAFENGFNRAFITVFDANITTLLAGAILYYFGSGPLKGFAIVLCVGIFTTLLTGYFASKVMIRAAIEGSILKKFSMLKVFSKANVKWMEKATIFKTMSLILVLASVILFVVKSKSNMGIDFSGGTAVNINFAQVQNIGDVRNTIMGITTVDPATKAKVVKYADAEVQSESTGLKNSLTTSSKEFQIRTKYVTTAEQVNAFKKDLQTAFVDKITPDQIISSTPVAIREYRYMIIVVLPASTDIKAVKDKLKTRCNADGFSDPELVEWSGSAPAAITASSQTKTFAIYFKEDNDIKLERIVREELGFSASPFSRVENIGGMVAKELEQNAVIAVVLSWITMILYLAFRFEVRYGIAAVIALIHDVLISLGSVILFNLVVPKSWGINVEINLSSVAAFLTIIGYSVNDTIVVFDRLRENFKLLKGESTYKIINRSINETLARTIWTSTTVFMTVTVLFIITARSGGGVPAFAFPMIIGTVFGTYSSVYIASAWLLSSKDMAEIKQDRLLAKQAQPVPAEAK